MDSSHAGVVLEKAESAAINLVAGVGRAGVFALSSPSEMKESIDPCLEEMLGLVSPFAGVHNLDLLPDAPSESSGVNQLWGLGQLTPSDGPFTSIPTADVDQPSIRSYSSEEEIVNAYYIYIHPFFPLIPPSMRPGEKDQPTLTRSSSEFLEANKADLPYWPKSSLSLALSAILVLVPHPRDQNPMDESSVFFRRTYAQFFAQAALSAVENETDNIASTPSSHLTQNDMPQDASVLHSKVLQQLDPILALVTLAMYEYCQRGNISHMRARVNQAITTSMDTSLHKLSSSTTEYSEAQRRAWWMTMFVAYQSSNLHHTPPIIGADDPRITTPFPEFGVQPEPWKFLVNTQKAFFDCHIMAQKIESGPGTLPTMEVRQAIKSLDTLIISLTTESDRCLRAEFDNQAKSPIAKNMWAVGRILIYTAFMDIPLFLDTYCDLVSINSHGISYPATPSLVWAAERESAFPFTEQESSNICLKSALPVAIAYKNLPNPISSTSSFPWGSIPAGKSVCSSPGDACTIPRTIPYFACSAMQSSYSLLMLLYKIRACLETEQLGTCYHLLNKPEPATETADAERLVEELRHGVECLSIALRSDVIFEGVGGMGSEVERAYLAAFSDRAGI
ncbi:hypothetical protein N7492_010660 [Penicillium capsulatum]|uniref:Transcription factor domain-containing protein n=1 Tax=Penicillium capsulatum TaxID=69766 RepID=A0A9W9HPL0_9EURO|nr:hypothetical protein N7492_010660 [Penicillium capsulatum]KAJ6113159.1 hypothetical protein N7512_008483 [Penicillium capsulatum]